MATQLGRGQKVKGDLYSFQLDRGPPFFSSPTDAQLSERSKKLSLNFSIGCSIFLLCKICIKSAPIDKKSQMMLKKFST